MEKGDKKILYQYVQSLDDSQIVDLDQFKRQEKNQPADLDLTSIEIALSYPNTYIFERLQSHFPSNKFEFQYIDSNQTAVILGKKKFRCLCFPRSAQLFYTKIKFSQSKQNKVLTIQAVIGDLKVIKSRIDEFKDEFNEKKVEQLSLNETFRQLEINVKNEYEERNTFSMECSSFSHLYETLTNKNYSVGKEYWQFKNKVENMLNNENKNKRQLNKIIVDIYIFNENIYETLNSDYNYLKIQSKDVFNYARQSVERICYFDMYSLILDKYCQLNQKIETMFIKKQNMLAGMHRSDIYKLIDIANKFEDLDLSKSVLELNKIGSTEQPRDQYQFMMMSYHLMKVALVNKQVSIANMDEELPIIIYLVIRSSIPSFYSRLNILEEYIQQECQYDLDRRIIVNFKVSVQYIADEIHL